MARDGVNGASAPTVPPVSIPSTTSDLPVRTKTPTAASGFDIVATYHHLLASDPDLTKPLAAIEALIELLRSTPTSTTHETLESIKAQTEILIASVSNPIPLQAGTDLFMQYILTSLQQAGQILPRPATGTPDRHHGQRRSTTAKTPVHVGANFEDIRGHLLKNARLFASRAKDARTKLAEIGSRYVLDDTTVLTHGGSRAVHSLLVRAAEKSRKRGETFKVVYVTSSSVTSRSRSSTTATTTPAAGDATTDEEHTTQGYATVTALRALGIPVAIIPVDAVSFVLPKCAGVFVGAEAICRNGAIISRLGTSQIAHLAKMLNVKVYVAGETHKMVRVYPLTQWELPGVRQEVVVFKGGEEDEDMEEGVAAAKDWGDETKGREGVVDYTAPDLITHLITENGLKIPSAVFEILLNIYD